MSKMFAFQLSWLKGKSQVVQSAKKNKNAKEEKPKEGSGGSGHCLYLISLATTLLSY